MFYTGIGSRNTPPKVLAFQTQIAGILEDAGYTLRSGGADGSDSAFEAGVKNDDKKVIYIPWDGFNGRYVRQENCLVHLNYGLPNIYYAYEMVAEIHPAPQKLKQGAKSLHARNIFQVVGHEELLVYSQFVLYYAEMGTDGLPIGGTRTAVAYAQKLGINCYNLYTESERERILLVAKSLTNPNPTP